MSKEVTLIARDGPEYPNRDLTPEHTKRDSVDHNSKGEIHSEIKAAYDYVDSILPTSDFIGTYAWHGWAVREAFLAGISHVREVDKDA